MAEGHSPSSVVRAALNACASVGDGCRALAISLAVPYGRRTTAHAVAVALGLSAGLLQRRDDGVALSREAEGKLRRIRAQVREKIVQGMEAARVLAEMHRLAPDWLAGCRIRPCWFEPTFHKHAGRLCSGLQIHTDDQAYDHHAFRPWRLQALVFKAIRNLWPDYPLWRNFAYEYEHDRLAIDVINGGPLLREWVDDRSARPGDLDAVARVDESAWVTESRNAD
jgi:hypothetical protein